MDDEQKRTRFLADLSCAFGATPDTPRSGIVTSIGLKGCFVKTKALVTKGQQLFVRVWMPENRWLRLRGTVKYHTDRVGFGVTFEELAEGEINDLAGLVEALRRRLQVDHPEQHSSGLL
jgi:hypothetical protein